VQSTEQVEGGGEAKWNLSIETPRLLGILYLVVSLERRHVKL
jgi:hypothetical protein